MFTLNDKIGITFINALLLIVIRSFVIQYQII